MVRYKNNHTALEGVHLGVSKWGNGEAIKRKLRPHWAVAFGIVAS